VKPLVLINATFSWVVIDLCRSPGRCERPTFLCDLRQESHVRRERSTISGLSTAPPEDARIASLDKGSH
jgi:hypothetical protein